MTATASKLQYIKDNIYIPEEGEWVEIYNDKHNYCVAYSCYDEHYLIPESLGIIKEAFYDKFMEFYKNLEDTQPFADGTTFPFVRDDTVVGPGLTTRIFYKSEVRGEMILVGYDEYPVICTESNGDCYFEGCEDWTVEDEVVKTDVHQVLASSLGGKLVEAKIIEGQAYGLEAEGRGYQLFRDEYPNTDPDVMSVDPFDKVDYFDMPKEDIQWLEVEK